jgi:hypothetical protein
MLDNRQLMSVAISIGKVLTIAVAMAVIALFLPPFRGNIGYLPYVLTASSLVWLAAAFYFTTREVPMKYALELGAGSPFVGAVILGVLTPPIQAESWQPLRVDSATAAQQIWGSILLHLAGAALFCWICIPIGLATSYLVYREIRRARLA